MTSDIFATAWEGLTWSGFEAGDTVAIFGAGPVGQMATLSAMIRGASKVYVVDRIAQRLDLAASIGAIPINMNASDPVQQILAFEPHGVTRAIDAVGFEARTANGTLQEDLVLRQALDVTQLMGGIGIVGVYDVRSNATGRPLAETLSQEIAFNVTAAFNKGIRLQTGSVDARQLAPQLLELIQTGKANPGYIVSAEISIEEAPDYYRRFSDWQETKVIIKF
jgi:threonine dehydrogenase-like Zn-dependent dehydrogenase